MSEDTINKIVAMYDLLKEARKNKTSLSGLLDNYDKKYDRYLELSSYVQIISWELGVPAAEVKSALSLKMSTKTYKKKSNTSGKGSPLVIVSDVIFGEKGPYMKNMRFLFFDATNKPGEFCAVIPNEILHKIKQEYFATPS